MDGDNGDETPVGLHTDGDEDPSPMELTQAIQSGGAPSVSRVLSDMTFDERRDRLKEAYAVPADEHSSPPGTMLPIFHAAHSGTLDVFTAVCDALQSTLDQDEACLEIGSFRKSSHSPQCADIATTNDIDSIAATLTPAGDAWNLLVTAIASGNVEIARAVVKLVEEHDVDMDKRTRMLEGVPGRNETAIMIAASTGNVEMVQLVVHLLMEAWVPSIDERLAIVTARNERGQTVLSFAVDTVQPHIVDAVVSLIERSVPMDKVNHLIENSLQGAISNLLMAPDEEVQTRALDVLAALLKHCIWPTVEQLSQIGHIAGFERAKKCFLDAVCQAVNPLLAGMILSLRLSEAAGKGKEGQRQKAARLQNDIEDLVLEIFERLPKTVDGFEESDMERESMQACSIVFAPEKVYENAQPGRFQRSDGGGARVTIGPLKISQQSRHQLELFCTQPLVLDYMARKFSTLPALTASEKQLHEAEEAQRCRHERLSIQSSTDDHSRGVWDELYVVLAGLHPIFGSVTFFPGAQFILSELATKPTLCYSVPAVRMVMHLIVYLAMLILFGSNVLLSFDDVGVGETIFFIYTMGAILIEIMELWDGRAEYMRDHWNLLDVLALAFCLAAFLVRVSYPSNHWGRALYCFGAPLLLFRSLFFAQFLPAQGPMIEIIFNLAGEVARFGTIMLVVLIGFAMSFYALFRHACVTDSFRNYSETFISLLRLMLGETKLFDDFSVPVECCDDTLEPSDELNCEDFLMECCHRAEEEHFSGVIGKVLLVLYLVLMGIILLNLLIAVLSEAYVDVKENIDVESKVSRALVIQHYVKDVENHHLPSPLNLLQYAFSLLALVVGFVTRTPGCFRRAEFFAGLTLFWITSGLFAVAMGSVLWVISWPKALVVFWTRRSNSGAYTMPLVIQTAVLMSGVAMPLYLLCQFIWASLSGPLLQSLAGAWTKSSGSDYSEIIEGGKLVDDGIIAQALKLGPGGLSVQKLREFLANPMNDPVVQRDEEGRATTVEHLKLLRDRLLKKIEMASKAQTNGIKQIGEQIEAMAGQGPGALDAPLSGGLDDLRAELETQMKAVVDDRVEVLSEKIDGLDAKLSKILRSLDPDT